MLVKADLFFKIEKRREEREEGAVEGKKEEKEMKVRSQMTCRN
jgi:hypothetical protein